MKLLLVLSLLGVVSAREYQPWWSWKPGHSCGRRSRRCFKSCSRGWTCLRSETARFGCCVRNKLRPGDMCMDAKYDRSEYCPRRTTCRARTHQPAPFPKYCLTKVCHRRKRCGGITGATCEKHQVCIDDPNDGCDPKTGADCGGCCVRNTCYGVTCSKGSECYVDAEGKPQCRPKMLKGCTTRCGRKVPHGWSGRDDGNNACNKCRCNDGLMGCTKIGCPQFTPECLKPGSICRRSGIDANDGPHRPNDCPEGYTCQAGTFTKDGRLAYTCEEPRVCCLALPSCREGFDRVKPTECTREDYLSGVCVGSVFCCQELICKKKAPMCKRCGEQDGQCGDDEACVDDPTGIKCCVALPKGLEENELCKVEEWKSGMSDKSWDRSSDCYPGTVCRKDVPQSSEARTVYACQLPLLAENDVCKVEEWTSGMSDKSWDRSSDCYPGTVCREDRTQSGDKRTVHACQIPLLMENEVCKVEDPENSWDRSNACRSGTVCKKHEEQSGEAKTVYTCALVV